MTHPADYDAQIFAARLAPHRSLARSHFRVLMLLVAGAGFFVTLPFVLLGAWPVVGFMGLDVLAFWWAFRINYRDARAYEDIRVTALELSVARVSAKGARREWRFNPHWVRLERQEIEDFGVTRLAIVSRDREVEVATCLGPDAKARFAGDLAGALRLARQGPRFN